MESTTTTIPRLSLRESGYHMTEADVETQKILAAEDFSRRRGELALVNDRIEQTAQELSVLAKQLRTYENLPFAGCPRWLNPVAIEEVLQDCELAKQRTREARERCNRLGLPVD